MPQVTSSSPTVASTGTSPTGLMGSSGTGASVAVGDGATDDGPGAAPPGRGTPEPLGPVLRRVVRTPAPGPDADPPARQAVDAPERNDLAGLLALDQLPAQESSAPAEQAVDADVHIVGISSLAAGHLTLVPQLREALTEQGRPDIMVVVGGVIPPDDVATLKEMGAAAVFLPGTVIAESALDLIGKLSGQLGH